MYTTKKLIPFYLWLSEIVRECKLRRTVEGTLTLSGFSRFILVCAQTLINKMPARLSVIASRVYLDKLRNVLCSFQSDQSKVLEHSEVSFNYKITVSLNFYKYFIKTKTF